MRLYDFSIYAQRRKEMQAAQAVVGLVAEINQPGSVIELKSRVTHWFALHQQVLRRANES